MQCVFDPHDKLDEIAVVRACPEGVCEALRSFNCMSFVSVSRCWHACASEQALQGCWHQHAPCLALLVQVFAWNYYALLSAGNERLRDLAPLYSDGSVCVLPRVMQSTHVHEMLRLCTAKGTPLAPYASMHAISFAQAIIAMHHQRVG